VNAVTSAPNIDLARTLGADRVIDYATTDFAGERRYDLILDTVGNKSVADLRRALDESGKAAVTGFTCVVKLMDVSLRGGKDIAMVSAHVATKDLGLLSDLIEAGKCTRRSTDAIRSPRYPPPSPTWRKATLGAKSLRQSGKNCSGL
jgi:NADPH:quinone reductase-like Zn-dependent oxidoreductase